MTRGAKISIALLWIVGSFTLWLSSYRPFTGTRGVAKSLPARIGAYSLSYDTPMTDRQFRLLGTDDAIWRTYTDADGHEIYVVLVCHAENWKSIHPPDICLRGSNMVITEDQQRDGHGELVLFSRDRRSDYVSLYRYGAADLATGSYLGFFLHHAPRALFRAAVGGYLVRVETWVDADGREAAVRRCESFLEAAEPHLRALNP